MEKTPKKTTNFKWPKTVSRFFVSFMAEQARAGYKVDKSFKGAAIRAATRAIAEKFPNTIVSETNCLNHYRTLKGRWAKIKEIKELSGVSWDESTKTIIMGEEQYHTYVAANPKAEPYINKPIEQYDEMTLVCGDDFATGSFSRSIGDPLGSPMVQHNLLGGDEMDNTQGTPNIPPSSSSAQTRKSGSKRTRSFVEEFGTGMVEGLKDLARAVSGQEWTNALWASVMELSDDFPRTLLNRAMFYLVKHKDVGQVVMAMDKESRTQWMQDFSLADP